MLKIIAYGIFILQFITSTDVKAQNVTFSDTIPKEVVKENLRRHSPKKAAVWSAMCPGLGQIYNKKYWKVPIVYAALGGLGFALGYNAVRWKRFSNAYRARIDGDSLTIDDYVDVYSESNLLTLKRFYKSNMDLSIVFTVIVYVLNIVDAAVDAHLFEYDVSDDLSLRIDPILNLSANRSNNFAGVKISLNLN